MDWAFSKSPPVPHFKSIHSTAGTEPYWTTRWWHLAISVIRARSPDGDSSAQRPHHVSSTRTKYISYSEYTITMTICTTHESYSVTFANRVRILRKKIKQLSHRSPVTLRPNTSFLNTRRPLQEHLCESSLPCYNLHLRVRMRACAVATKA